MYRSFTLKNFRCFHQLTVEPLERVTLIAGKNNVGKSAFLEGLFLHLGPNNPQLPLRLNAWRGGSVEMNTEGAWRWLFSNSDTSETIELNSLHTNGIQRSLRLYLVEPEIMAYDIGADSLTTSSNSQGLKLSYQDSTGQSGTSQVLIKAGQFVMQHATLSRLTPASVFLSTHQNPQQDAKRFSQLEAVNRQHELLPTLRQLEPRIRRLALLFDGPTPQIHADIGIGRLVPFPQLGEGTKRLLSLLLTIATTANGIVLIDEIENGLHHSVLVDVWQGLAQAARQANVQVIATTHSYECIRAAYQAFETDEVLDFRLHRLERIKGQIEAVSYDQETLDIALEANLEVR